MKKLRKRLKKLAGLITEQDNNIIDNCDLGFDSVGLYVLGADNVIIDGVDWHPFNYEGPNFIVQSVTQAGTGQTQACENMILTDIVSETAPGMQVIMEWVMDQIWAGNPDVSYDTPFDQVFWQDPTPTYYGSPMGAANGGWNNYDYPAGACKDPATGNGYRRYQGIFIQLTGYGNLPGSSANNGANSWAEVFAAIEEVQPLVAYGGENMSVYVGDAWWQRFGGYSGSTVWENLNTFLSYDIFDLGTIQLACGAQGSCVHTCMCMCAEENCEDQACNITLGCTDPLANNYNPEATIGNPCVGWVNSTSPTYGNAAYTALLYMANGGNWYLNFGSQSPFYDNPPSSTCTCNYTVGCTDISAGNFNDSGIPEILNSLNPSLAWDSFGGSTGTDNPIYGMEPDEFDGGNLSDIIDQGIEFPSIDGFCGWSDVPTYQDLIDCLVSSGIFIPDGTECTVPIGGCIDPNAINYEENATENDGSCYYEACMDYTAANYGPNSLEGDPNVPFDEGGIDGGAFIANNDLCEYLQGCPDENAINYGVPNSLGVYGPPDPNYLAIIDDGSCIYGGCTDPNAENYDETIPLDADDGSCILPDGPIGGCTDPDADNYDPEATAYDGSCEYTDPCEQLFSFPLDVQEQWCEAYYTNLENPETSGTGINPQLAVLTDNGSCCEEVEQDVICDSFFTLPQWGQETLCQGCPENLSAACPCCPSDIIAVPQEERPEIEPEKDDLPIRDKNKTKKR